MKMTNLKCGHSLLQNDGSHAHIVIIRTCKVCVVISNNESSMVTCTLTMCISTQSMHLEIGFIRIYRVYEDFMFLLEIPSSYGKIWFEPNMGMRPIILRQRMPTLQIYHLLFQNCREVIPQRSWLLGTGQCCKVRWWDLPTPNPKLTSSERCQPLKNLEVKN